MNEQPVFFRTLPLQGGINLRDMGGYATADGRRVKTGMLYRSGIMSKLTEADNAHMASLGIRVVCDLRNVHERSAHPTHWAAESGTQIWGRDYSELSGILGEVLKSIAPTDHDAYDAMIRLYREIPVDHAESYRWMFARLLDGEVPLLFNCTAGKDRTGVGGALLLHALGVPYDTVVEDYAETNRTDFAPLTDAPRSQRSGVPADVSKRMMAADPDYLASAWAALDHRYGGVDAYLASELGVDAAGRERLGALLLD